MNAPTDDTQPSHFIRQVVERDLAEGITKTLVTRFPPEPNGHLHIGHAKSICLNFGLARDYSGRCHLRFDDTNPSKESEEFVTAIKRDVRWLGFDWGEHLYHASDYFEQLYQWAEQLIERGLAYVDSQSADEMRSGRGTLTEPGVASPFRDRSIAANLELFRGMRAGEFADGSHVLRARIDMAAPNMTLRDPTLYRIRRAHHQRTGDQWCIYPMYDFAHGQSDAIEGVTHSICTLEFADHRPLYDWLIANLDVPNAPRQYEFSRLNLDYTVMSKRLLNRLVDEKLVAGWDDPRMPTLSGMRRRGYPAVAVRDFCDRIGVTKQENRIELSLLETCVRENLDSITPRANAVVRPVKVIIENYPENQTEQLSAPVHPKDPSMGERSLPFGREIYIEQDDFLEDPPKKFFRLKPGGEVRLRYAYIVKCESVSKDDDGHVREIRVSYDPQSKSGGPTADRKVKGVIHWVAVPTAVPVEVRLYDRLFNVANPRAEEFTEQLNPESMEIVHGFAEPGLSAVAPGAVVQFERLGYFCADAVDSRPDRLVFNRTVTLRDTWARINK